MLMAFEDHIRALEVEQMEEKQKEKNKKRRQQRKNREGFLVSPLKITKKFFYKTRIATDLIQFVDFASLMQDILH